MIIVKLIGGLGNQMFQYAAGRCLAHLHETELLMDTSYLEKDPKGAYTKRKPELDVFHIDLKVATKADVERFNVEGSNKYSRALQRRLPILFTNLYVAESGTTFHKEFFSYPENTYLDGFWQSELYFNTIESILVNDFVLRDPLNRENKDWLKKIEGCESVSLHVRRGDYVFNAAAQSHHGSCDADYYKKAIESIKEDYKDIEVFVFSDDLNWCKANLKIKETLHFVDVNQRENQHLDMFLMSHCKHNVIANSSFSWWAAWLNRNDDKIVIAPLKWFSDPSIKTYDLIPKEWIRL
jgi:hypothetical protein